MIEIILVIVGVACLLAGWGWHMSPRWVRLLCRTLTVYRILTIPVLLGWNWINPYYMLLIIPFIAIPLGFFWELIPFPIIQFFKTDNITTIRIERKVKGTSGIGYRRDMKRNPQDFIFPYIQEVNISPIINGLDYLLLKGGLANTLPCRFNLDKVLIRLFITELSTREQPIIEEQSIIEEEPTTKELTVRKSLDLYAESRNDLSNFRIRLTKKAQESVIKFFQQNKSVEAYLHISGFDNKGREHLLLTNQVSIALLNGRELYKNDTENT